MGADPTYTTISGFSGGAFMADVMLVASSETFKGMATHAGGPYGIGDFEALAGIGNFELNTTSVAE